MLMEAAGNPASADREGTMYSHPSFTAEIARQRHNDMIASARQRQLLRELPGQDRPARRTIKISRLLTLAKVRVATARP
jgi:hypothetical protein